MPSLKEVVNSLRTNSLHHSIFYFQSSKLINKNYKDLFEGSDIVSSRLNRILELYPTINYFGLFINHNLYLPAIILGCINCDKPFVCLDVEAGDDFILELLVKLHIAVIFTLLESSDRVKKFFKSPILFEEFEIWGARVQLWTNGENRSEYTCVPKMLYAVQTSGSTGKPKIVQVPEDAIVPNISHLRAEFNVMADDVILLASPPTFDLFMIELLLALTTGAALLTVPSEVRASPLHLLDAIFPAASRPLVTIAQLTPSVFMRWTPAQIRSRVLTSHTTLRVLALGGERFPPAEFWQSCRVPDNRTQLYNLYGTTELSCWAMIGTGLDHSLGSAMSQTLLRVQTDLDNAVEEGMGHLFIGSETRICVVGDEDWQELRPPIYRATGDIVTVNNGVYQYVGRKDNIVKRWGHRVSLDQVEAVAAKCTDVRAACCILHSDLLCLFVSLQARSTGIDAVRAKLKSLMVTHLNKASLPDLILQEDHLPLTRHGKINKNNLKQILSEVKNDENSFKKPVDMFRALWRKYLLDESEEDTGFLSGGGNSVMAMQIVNEMTQRGVDLSLTVLTEMLTNRSFRDCCRLVEQQHGSVMGSELVTKTGIVENDGPLSKRTKLECEQEVLFVKMKGCSEDLMEGIEENAQLNIAWAYNLGKCVDATPTCVVYKSGKCCVLVGSHSGRVAALQLSNGAVLWDTQLPDRIESSITPSSCGSLGLVGCYNGSVYCLSLMSGSIVWNFRTQTMVKGTALAVAESWVFGSYDYCVYCITVTDGELVWKHKMEGIVLATPLHLPCLGLVLVASLTGQVAALNCVTGDVRWQVALPSPVFSSPAVVAGLVLIAEVAGTLHALQPDSGSQAWQFKAGGKIFSSAAVLKSKVMFGCHDNLVYCLQCSQQAVQLLWTHTSESAVYATPCLLTPHHLAIASTAGRVSIVDLASGEAVSSVNLPGHIFSSPVAFRLFIAVGCRDDNVYCLKINKK